MEIRKLTPMIKAWVLASLLALSCDSSTPKPVENAPQSPETATDISFTRHYVDTRYGGNGRPGWVRAGDMDRDGDLDIVAGGGFALFLYENTGNASGWIRHGNLDGSGQMGANGGVLFDVDGDRDLDVVSATYKSDLGWWENPGGTPSDTPWRLHRFSGNVNGAYLHDIIRVDLDQDGVAAEFVAALHSGSYWHADIELKWFQPGVDPVQPWTSHVIEPGRNEGRAHGHAGIAAGDVDGDGDIDVAYSNGWYEASGDPSGSWKWRQVTDAYGISNTLLGDMDDDGDLDLVMSGGHHGQGVYWFENDANDQTVSWARHRISAVLGDIASRHRYERDASEHVHHPECLAVQDMDDNGDLDVVTCDLFFGGDSGEPGWDEEVHNIYLFENHGQGASWSKRKIVSNAFPSHLLQLVDLNEDGRIDLISEATGHSVVSYYENTTAGTTPPRP